MINLIPTNAKKGIVKEYWTRVFSVWFSTWSVALLLSAFIMVPAYVLIYSQAAVFEESAAFASEKIANYQDVSEQLIQSSQEAQFVITNTQEVTFSDYISLFQELRGSEISLSQISINRTSNGIEPIQISGVAEDRQSLAAFRERLLAEEQIIEANLPISNLARDRDIQFSITATIDNSIAL